MIFQRHNKSCCCHCRRASFYACRLDKHLYVIGGRNETGYLSSVECYNLDTNEWRYVSSLPQPLAAHAGAVHNGKIYISGKPFFHLPLQSRPSNTLTWPRCVCPSQGVCTTESMSRGCIVMTRSWMSGPANKTWTRSVPSTLWLWWTIACMQLEGIIWKVFSRLFVFLFVCLFLSFCFVFLCPSSICITCSLVEVSY